MQTFTKILFSVLMVLTAASYGVYILTDPLTFVAIVYPAAIVFALLYDMLSDHFRGKQQEALAARIDSRLVEQYEQKKQRETRAKLLAKK